MEISWNLGAADGVQADSRSARTGENPVGRCARRNKVHRARATNMHSLRVPNVSCLLTLMAVCRDAVIGRRLMSGQWVAVPQNDDVGNEVRAIGLKHHERNSHGVSCRNRRLAESSVCVVDATGKLVREVKNQHEAGPVEELQLHPVGPMTDILHTVFVSRRSPIRGIRFLGARCGFRRIGAARASCPSIRTSGPIFPMSCRIGCSTRATAA
jgi:hypothetical protein